MITATFFIIIVACLGLVFAWKRRYDEAQHQRIAAALKRAIRDGVVGASTEPAVSAQ